MPDYSEICIFTIIKMGHGRRIKIYDTSGTTSAFVLDVGETRDNFIPITYRQKIQRISFLSLFTRNTSQILKRCGIHIHNEIAGLDRRWVGREEIPRSFCFRVEAMKNWHR
jgi:hypothetical protein